MATTEPYIEIGTIEPRWTPFVNNLKEWECREILAFIYGAFLKYNEGNKSEYTNMNQDLCDYVRKILKLTPNSAESEIPTKENDQSVARSNKTPTAYASEF